MPNSHQLLLLILFFPSHYLSSTSSPTTLTYPVLGEGEAEAKFCNGTTIPFPFGVPGFTLLPPLPGFNITCQHTNTFVQTSSPRLSLSTLFFSGELPILSFSLADASLRVALTPATWRCDRNFIEQPVSLPDLRNTPFTYSASRNVFAVIGCDSMVTLRPQGDYGTVRFSCA